MNTAIFLQSMLTQSVIFLLNNGGAPYIQGLKESPRKLQVLIISVIVPLVLAQDYFSDLT